MKRFIVLTIICSIHFAYANAKAADPNENCKTKALPILETQENLGDVKKLKDGIEDSEIKKVAKQLCSTLSLSLAQGSRETWQYIEDIMLKYLEIDKKTKNYKFLVSEFWNKYAQKFICIDDHPLARTPQQFMKRVIDFGLQDDIFYNFLLFDEEEYPIRVNHIEYYNGEPETVLDYIDSILKDPKNEKKYEFKQVKALREVLIEDYNAKKAREIIEE